ncbi:DUF4829 domain-containing protein [Clostridium thermobutyricum]|uniref:DUF4829 domain-containing protein n=1 Tax=Clostridium thermobutyricum TaxID=29372 RepID=UPI003F5258DC
MRKYIFLGLITIMLLPLSLTQCNTNDKNLDKTEYEYPHINEALNELYENRELKSDIEAENTIRRAIESKNNKDEKQVKRYYEDRYRDSDFRLENLKSIKLKKIEFIDDINMYKQYIKDWILVKKINIEDLKIYLVTYDAQYIDELKETVGNGEDMKYYTLIKEETGDWKIHQVGEW